ncbi:hypothetical protein AAY473_012546 [Plecturocebus cupreus]
MKREKWKVLQVATVYCAPTMGQVLSSTLGIWQKMKQMQALPSWGQLDFTVSYKEKEKQDLTLLLRLECSGIVIAQCSLELLGSTLPPTSDSQDCEGKVCKDLG